MSPINSKNSFSFDNDLIFKISLIVYNLLLLFSVIKLR